MSQLIAIVISWSEVKAVSSPAPSSPSMNIYMNEFDSMNAAFASRGEAWTNATPIMNFKSGKRAVLNCGMVLDTETPERFDRIDNFRIHGTKGSIRSEVQFNQCGKLSYVVSVGGKEEVKVVDTPQNYCLEVEQFGRCIAEGEELHVSQEFTLKNARLMDRILETIHY